MQSTMSLTEGLQRQASQDSYLLEGSLRKKGRLWHRRSLKGHSGKQNQNGENPAGTLPRGWRQPRQTHSNSLVDYADPQRTTHLLEKNDNEAYGFEVQTYGVQLKSSAALEMCTFVCRVEEDSAAENAGLTAGDVILTINGISIEGSSHQHIIDLIRESTKALKMETVCGTVVKRIELEKKMNLLKQTLREKWMELQTLTSQEKRLARGNLSDSSLHPSMDSLASLMSSTGHHSRRFSSDSSCRSAMTEDSDMASVFGDVGSPSPCSVASPTDDRCFFSGRDFRQEGPRSTSSSGSGGPGLNRGRSGSLASSGGSLSPSWEGGLASIFGTLPRRGRRTASVRRHILKFIPGLNRSLEEDEDTCVNGHTKARPNGPLPCTD